MDDGVQDDAGDECLGFLVPVRLARLPRRIMDQRVGDRLGIFREVGAGRVEPRQRVVAGRWTPGDTERVQAPRIAFAGPRAGRDAGILGSVPAEGGMTP
jgi:hypothetical protein